MGLGCSSAFIVERYDGRPSRLAKFSRHVQSHSGRTHFASSALYEGSKIANMSSQCGYRKPIGIVAYLLTTFGVLTSIFLKNIMTKNLYIREGKITYTTAKIKIRSRENVISENDHFGDFGNVFIATTSVARMTEVANSCGIRSKRLSPCHIKKFFKIYKVITF